MSEELDALKDFYIFFKQCEIENKYDKQLTNHFLNLHNIIEKALIELGERREMMRRFNEACVPTILEDEVAKKLSALDIIKNNPFNNTWFVYYKDYEDYYENAEYVDESKRLTKEEYDLLKEISNYGK